MRVKELLPKALSLVNQGEVVDMSEVSYTIDGKRLTIDLGQIPHNDGFYNLTVNTTLIVDQDGHVGMTASPVTWIEQTGKPITLNLTCNFPEAATVKVVAMEYQGVKTNYQTPQTPADSYPYGTTLTLQVEPHYGYIFNRWSIDGNILSTERTYNYYLSANKELKIFFDRQPFNLSVSNIVNNDTEATAMGGNIRGGGTGIYEYGETVELTAEPERCHKFIGWYTVDNGGSASSRQAPLRVPAGLPRRTTALDGLTLLTTDRTYVYTVGGTTTLYPVFHRMGDVNGDGQFTIADVVLEANYIRNGSATGLAETEADANDDNSITISDVVEIANSVKTK